MAVARQIKLPVPQFQPNVDAWIPFPVSIIHAINAGKIRGEGQIRVILNLVLKHSPPLAPPVAEIRLSASELGALIGLSSVTAQATVSEFASRCGNADPEWVKEHGKCPDGECVCPKLLTVTKKGNRNALRVNLENFPIAPRYIPPPPKPIAQAKPETPKNEHKADVAPGKRWTAPFSLLAEKIDELIIENAAKLHLALVVTRRDGRAVARIETTSEAANYQAGFGDQKANIVKPKRLSNYDLIAKHVNSLLRQFFGKPPARPSFAKQITKAAPDVDPARYLEYASAELKIAAKAGAKKTTGILLTFAKDLQRETKIAAAEHAEAEAATKQRTTEAAHASASLDANVCPACHGKGATFHNPKDIGGTDCAACGGTGVRAEKGRGAS